MAKSDNPQAAGKPEAKQITFTLPSDLRKGLEEMAERHKVTLEEQIRSILAKEFPEAVITVSRK